MKKLRILSALVFVPALIGILLFMIGGWTLNFALVEVGKYLLIFGLPAGIVSYGIAFIIIDAKSKSGKIGYNTPTHESKPGSGKSAPGERQLSEDEYSSVMNEDGRAREEREAAPKRKRSEISSDGLTAGGKVFWGILVVLLLIAFSLIFVFVFLENTKGAIISAVVIFVAMFMVLIFRFISEKISLSFDKDKSHYNEITEGTVRSCTVSTTVEVMGRPSRVVYKLIVEVGDRDYVTHSKKPYSVGDTVTVAVRSRRRVSIVE